MPRPLLHGWDFSAVPIVEFVLDEASLSTEQQYTISHPAEVELATTTTRLNDKIARIKPSRLVIDSLSELRLLSSDSVRYRRQLLALKQFLVGRGLTALLSDDRTADGHDPQLQNIAHGVIRLEKVPRSFGVTRRRVEVMKLRGSTFREGFYRYTIQRGGMMVYPRLVAAEHGADFAGEQFASGVEALDRLFGGGIPPKVQALWSSARRGSASPPWRCSTPLPRLGGATGPWSTPLTRSRGRPRPGRGGLWASWFCSRPNLTA